jgi:hypothetical protein
MKYTSVMSTQNLAMSDGKFKTPTVLQRNLFDGGDERSYRFVFRDATDLLDLSVIRRLARGPPVATIP